MDSVYFWLVLGCVLIVAEAIIPGVYVLWIGVAAILTAGIVALFPLLGSWILLFFALVTILSAFVGTRVFLLMTSKVTTLNDMRQQLIGKRGTCIARHDGAEIRIRIDGVEWAALADSELDVGDAVVVLRFQDAKPVVRSA